MTPRRHGALWLVAGLAAVAAVVAAGALVWRDGPSGPPPVAEDLLAAVDIRPATVGTPPDGAVIGSLNAAYELTGLSAIDGYGTGDAARGPAPGHRLIAFQVEAQPGEAGEAVEATASPTVAVQVDDDPPRDVTDLLGEDAPIVVSVPDDAEAVDLMVTDADVEQRLSLLDGTPASDNVQVLTRINRSQELGTVHQVSATAAGPGGSGPATGAITVNGVRLDWFLPQDPATHPSARDAAFLVVSLGYRWVELSPRDGGLTERPFTLELPDGQAVEAANLAPDPDADMILGFEVPADFTTGTLHIQGVDRQASGVTVDFGADVYSTPISIPPG